MGFNRCANGHEFGTSACRTCGAAVVYRCTCGSGAHPRRCEAHPGAFEAHVAELNREAAIGGHAYYFDRSEPVARLVVDFKPVWIRRKAPQVIDCTACGIEARRLDAGGDRRFIDRHARCAAPPEKSIDEDLARIRALLIELEARRPAEVTP